LAEADAARKDAGEHRAKTQHALIAAWIAVGVSVVLGVVEILAS
jgi:hypothetical protein